MGNGGREWEGCVCASQRMLVEIKRQRLRGGAVLALCSEATTQVSRLAQQVLLSAKWTFQRVSGKY